MDLSSFKVAYRKADPGDVHFIFSTWLRSYKYDSPATGAIRQDIYYENHQLVLEKLLSKPTTEMVVCCEEADPSFILGYIVFEKLKSPILHFLYVKKNWREENVVRDGLFNEAGLPVDLEGCEFTHYVNWITEARHAGHMKGLYNPYRAYFWR